MNVFDKLLGDWIRIIDYQNIVTIEDYGYNTGIVEGTTANHCVKCVAVNGCWFKNEVGKKPERFDLTGINLIDCLIKGLIPGLYHFRCHCQETPIVPYGIAEIRLIVPNGKISYLLKSKSGWLHAMGYHEGDYEVFIQLLLEKTKEAYLFGNYYIENITKYGCKINLMLDIPGVNEKSGRVYKIETNYMIFPDGKLKMNTPIGGWQK